MRHYGISRRTLERWVGRKPDPLHSDGWNLLRFNLAALRPSPS